LHIALIKKKDGKKKIIKNNLKNIWWRTQIKLLETIKSPTLHIAVIKNKDEQKKMIKKQLKKCMVEN